MRTAISIPDGMFREAEQAAKRLKLSRSELYQRALEAFIIAQRDRELKASYDAAFGGADEEGQAQFRRLAARKVLLGVEWKE